MLRKMYMDMLTVVTSELVGRLGVFANHKDSSLKSSEREAKALRQD